MHIRRTLLAIGIASICSSAVVAQQMSLQEVVDRAIEQSLVVEGAEQRLLLDQVALKRDERSRYPSLAFQTNGGAQFGLNVDPTTNLLERQTIGFVNLSLDAGATLYAGGRIRNSIKRSQANVAASEADVAANQQDVALRATQLYLEALLAAEALDNAEVLRNQVAAQLRTLTARIDAGQVAPVERFEAEANFARQEQTVVASQNARRSAILQLEQLLRLPAGASLEVAVPASLDLDAVVLPEVDARALYAEAAARQPSVRAARLAEEAAALGIDVARAGYLPTLSAFGQANTRYSSAAVRRVSDGTSSVIEQTVIFNGQEVSLGFPQPNVGVEDQPLGSQLSDFFGQAVGLSLRVPILSQGQNAAAVAQAQISTTQARLQREQAELDLRIETEQALLNAQNARAEVAAARRALAAAEAAFQAASRRAELGAGNDFDLSDQQLLLEQAQISLLRARYQYVFNAKVVDFYLGRPLTL